MNTLKMSWPDSEFDYGFGLPREETYHVQHLRETIDSIIQQEVKRREQRLCQILWTVLRNISHDPILLHPNELTTIPCGWKLSIETVPETGCWKVHATIDPDKTT